jgi:hypothetical protein
MYNVVDLERPLPASSVVSEKMHMPGPRCLPSLRYVLVVIQDFSFPKGTENQNITLHNTT